MTTPLTLDRMRADVARALREDPADIGLDDNLLDLGLDSMRLLKLLLDWKDTGAPIEMTEFGGETTLNAWWGLVQRHHSAQNPTQGD